MGGAKRSTWVGGTVFAAVVILAAAWFLAVSPALSAAAEVRDRAQETRDHNDLLELQVVKLKADYERLPEYRAELAGLQQQIPTGAGLAEYLRQLDQVALAHGVTLVDVAPSTPQEVTLAAAEQAPAPAADAADPAQDAQPDGTLDEQAQAQTPSGPSAPEGLAAVPVSFTVVGGYDATVAFLDDVQRTVPRLFLVSGLTGTSQPAAEAGSGRPATALGDQELVVTGYLYVLPDAAAAQDPQDTGTAPVLPPAQPGRNPLVPVAGS